MKLIVDRLEGAFAVVEMPDRTMINLPKILIPGAVEGDVVIIRIDREDTEKRKREIEGLMNDVFNTNP